MDTRGRAGFAVGLCPCQSVTRHLTLYFISALLLLAGRPQIADGVCVEGPVILTQPAGYIGSDGSDVIPIPPPSGNLPSIPRTPPTATPLPAGLNCTWIIDNVNITAVYLEFYQLNLNAGDFLYIYNGSGLLMQTYKYNDPPTGFTMATDAITINFVTESASNGTGFGLYYQTGGCMYGVETVSALSGTLNDGSGGNLYFPQLLCGFLISAPENNSVIRIAYTGAIEAGFDFVTVYDGSDANARRIGISMNYTTPFTVDSSGPNLYFTWFTDKRTNIYGWEIDYQIMGNYCTGVTVFNDTQGQISDGSGDADYLPNSDCGFIIQSAVGDVEVFFSAFDLGPGDYLTIYDGDTPSGTPLATYTGSNIPPHVGYPVSSIFLQFTSDGSGEGQGFTITYHAGGCTTTAEVHGDASGVINDGSGNSSYPIFIDCLWLFDYSQVDGISGIAYNFTLFNLEFRYDSVTVYDGATVNSPTLFQASGIAANGSFFGQSSGKFMLVRFLTDQSISGEGWNMAYNPVYPSSSSDDTALIVGLAVGLGGGSVLCCLILLLLILILVLLFWRRKAPVVLELKEPDYLALTWNIPIVEDGNFSYQDHTKRLRVLEKFILTPAVVEAISSLVNVKPEAMSEVAYATLLIHQTNNKSIKMLKNLLLREIVNAECEVPLREDSMATMCFKMFAHLVGLPFLWDMFAFPVAELELRHESEGLQKRRQSTTADILMSSSGGGSSSPHSFRRSSKLRGNELSLFSISSTLEVNPDKLEEGQDKKVNQLQLQLLLQKLFLKIINSAERFPPALRYLLFKLQTGLEESHPQLLHLMMGNLVFLRFLCPALILPQKYGITRNAPNPSTQRTLILITKVLTNLSNKVQFGSKEPYMLPLNKFITDNTGKIEDFFDELGSPAVKPLFGDPPSSIVPNNYRKNAMVTMYTYVLEHADDLEMKLKELLPEKNKHQKIIRALYYLKGRESDTASPFNTGSHLTSLSSQSDGEGGSDVMWVGEK